MNYSGNKETREKRFVALTSVFAAILLTGMKLVVGLLTGSLGILSEALHSGLDLVAAGMTFFAVKIADKPADDEHQFGHGKVENLSALGETLLLFFTCIWIIYEGYERLSSGKTHIDVTFWSFAVIIVSIIIDITRSRALNRTAKKYNSQALEADALHFSTDILSSFVVLIGLVSAYYDYHIADSIAALVVALIVIWISIRLGKKSIDALLDRSPIEMKLKIADIVSQIPEVTHYHNIKLRTSGSNTFVEMNIHVDSSISIERAHEISHLVEDKIKSKLRKCNVHIHTEPESDNER
ncbi:MAG: cation transporter [Bacteroidetes bacterium]|nr:MAG: cation transporter [Bacteroidota bacterium]